MKLLSKTALLAGASLACVTGASAQDTVKLLVWGDPVRQPFYEAFDAARENIEVEFVSVARNEAIAKLQLA